MLNFAWFTIACFHTSGAIFLPMFSTKLLFTNTQTCMLWTCAMWIRAVIDRIYIRKKWQISQLFFSLNSLFTRKTVMNSKRNLFVQKPTCDWVMSVGNCHYIVVYTEFYCVNTLCSHHLCITRSLTNDRVRKQIFIHSVPSRSLPEDSLSFFFIRITFFVFLFPLLLNLKIQWFAF